MKINFTLRIGGGALAGLALLFFNSTELFSQSGSNCSSAIPVTPTATCTPTSYTTTDSVMYFSFIANQKYAQIVGISSVPLGTAAPHIHRLTLFSGSCSALQTVEDEFLPNIAGANELQVDASNLTIGSTYYVRVTREPSSASAGCAPTPSPTGECHAAMSWTFNFCIRSLNILIPKDFGLEPAAISHAYYQGKGQVTDINNNPRFDIKGYTNNSSPAVYVRDTAVSFVLAHVDTSASTNDTMQRVDMTLVGSNQNIRTFKTEKITTYLNYFLAPLVPDGAVNIKGYSRDVLNDIYPNIDMQFYSNTMGTKFYFIIKPTANPNTIVMNFAGANAVNATSSGGLDMITSIGTINFEAGHAYQINPAGNIVPMPWQAKFIALGNNQFKFDIHPYDKIMPLIIQVDRGHKLPSPSATDNMDWSTWLGNNNAAVINKIKADATGNVFVTGYADNGKFPITTFTSFGSFTNEDAFIAKFDKNAIAKFATYWGGTANETSNSLALDASGNIYFVGNTDIGVTLPFFQPCSLSYSSGIVSSSSPSGFVVALNSFGTIRLWATAIDRPHISSLYFPSNVTDVAVNSIGDIYIVGRNFPALSFSGMYNSTVGDGGIARFSAASNPCPFQALWFTRFGAMEGKFDDCYQMRMNGIAINSSNDVFITGTAIAVNCTAPIPAGTPVCAAPANGGFPLCNPGGGAYFQGAGCIDGTDGFISEFDPTNNLLWSTFFCGNKFDDIHAIAIDFLDNIYIGGSTLTIKAGSPLCSVPINGGFPLCDPGSGAYYVSTHNSQNPLKLDGFVAKFAAANKNLIWSTYIGGNDDDQVNGIFATTGPGSGNVFITGSTKSTNYPLLTPSNYYTQSLQGTQDAFISMFPSNLSLLWSTYLGGNSGKNTSGNSIVFSGGEIYAVGSTTSPAFPQRCPGASAYCQATITPAPPANALDGFISRFVTINVGINELSDGLSLKIYPNPSSSNSILTIELPDNTEGNFKLILYNFIGEKIKEYAEKKSSSEKSYLQLPELSRGIYLLSLQFDGKIYYQKLIVQ